MNEDQQHYLRLIQKGNPLNKANNLSLVHPEDEGYMAEKINLLLEGKIDSFTETYRKYVDGDDLRWFNTSVRTYSYDQDGKAEIVVCLTTDVTEIRKKDIELFEIKEADKIKTAFIKSMSHEIRTPLNVIVGFSKVMADNNDTEENRQFFDAIQANNEILLRIIDSILSLTKSETGAIQYMKECVDIKDICRSAFSLKSASRKPHLEFVFDENQPSILVNTDSEHIKQALYHLLDNANKYTNQGHVKLSYYQCNEDEVRVEIIDSGIGLTQQQIDKIFQHFYKRDHFQLGVG
jgi:signal transduction histidine kinase